MYNIKYIICIMYTHFMCAYIYIHTHMFTYTFSVCMLSFTRACKLQKAKILFFTTVTPGFRRVPGI